VSNNFFCLDNRSVIKISGGDAKKFLQGLTTNDTNQISSENWLYSYMLSPQGRILFDFFMIEDRDSVLLDCPRSHVVEIMKKLVMYKLKSDIKIEDLSSKLFVYISLEPISQKSFQDPRDKNLPLRTISPAIDCGDTSMLSTYHNIRITHKVPDYDLDMVYNRSLPEEIGAERINAVSFTKGCYVGQEVTARLHHRGKLRKFIYVVESVSGDIPAKESEFLVDGKKIGVMLGAYQSKGLALINIDAIDSDSPIGIEMDCNNSRIKVIA
jgi:hypothetical protein